MKNRICITLALISLVCPMMQPNQLVTQGDSEEGDAQGAKGGRSGGVDQGQAPQESQVQGVRQDRMAPHRQAQEYVPFTAQMRAAIKKWHLDLALLGHSPTLPEMGDGKGGYETAGPNLFQGLGDKERALFSAILARDLNSIQDLMKQQVNINAQDALGKTPLMYAI